MIPLLSREQSRTVDSHAVDTLGLPSLVLMENAGRGAFEVLRARFPQALDAAVIVGGPGQNGGDGWVVARHLLEAGYWPRCVLVGDPLRLSGDAAINYATLARLGVTCSAVTGDDLSELDSALGRAEVVIDALFGTGLDRPVTGRLATVIDRINACEAKVLALDLPSGVDADSGAVLGNAVQADVTVTFAAHKRGLHQYPGARLRGELHCAGIGVPAPSESDVTLMEARDVAATVPPRKLDAHKGDSGHVLVFAGEAGKSGAAVLAATAALRAGAGLVTLVAREEQAPSAARRPELMSARLVPGSAAESALELARDKQAAVLGPGFGLDARASELARTLATSLPIPTVLDADALTALGTSLAALARAVAPRVLTPHPGEAARLLGTATERVQADRYAAAAKLARESACVTVLKGAGTIIAAPSGAIRVCGRGTPAMAVAGTGDVLAGTIGALLPILDPFDAAACGVYLHACAGELAATGDRGLFASELADALPRALAACRGAS